MADDRLMQSMLLDFYGELLTEKQRRCYDLHFNEDLSLSEIAEECGVSRQGVWDNIRRAEALLKETEEKTGLISRFESTRQKLDELYPMLCALRDMPADKVGKSVEEVIRIVDELRSQE